MSGVDVGRELKQTSEEEGHSEEGNGCFLHENSKVLVVIRDPQNACSDGVGAVREPPVYRDMEDQTHMNNNWIS